MAKGKKKEVKEPEEVKPIELILPVDVSTGKKDIFYARRNEKVTVVTDRDPVYIVKNSKGERFPVRKDIF